MIDRRSFLGRGATCATLLSTVSASSGQENRSGSSSVTGYDYRLPKFEKGARLLFQGDSITDMKWGRNQKDRNHYLGHSYVYLIAARLGMDMPEAQLDFYNRGMSGHKVSDLRARWQKDTLDLKPDWLSILVGVNDVSRGERGTLDFPKWEEDYRFLVARSRKENPNLRIVLMDPFVLRMTRLSADDVWKRWRGEIDKLGEIVNRLAREFKAVHLETQKIFDQAPKKFLVSIGFGTECILCPGHELIARNWLQA